MCFFPIFPFTNRKFYCSYSVHLSVWCTECVEINNTRFCSCLDYEEFQEDLMERTAHYLKTLDSKSNEENG